LPMWMFPVGWIPEKSVFFATVSSKNETPVLWPPALKFWSRRGLTCRETTTTSTCSCGERSSALGTRRHQLHNEQDMGTECI